MILTDKKIMWKSIIQASKGQATARIGDHSIDGLARWIEFYQSSLGADTECPLSNWPLAGVSLPVEPSNSLLLTFAEADQLVEQLSTKGPEQQGQQVAPKFTNAYYIQFIPSNQCPKDYFHLQSGSYTFEGCFQNQYKETTFYGIEIAFYIDDRNQIQYVTSADPSAKLYSISSYYVKNVKLLLSASVIKNKPVITYLDNSNNVHTVDTNGAEVTETK